MSDHEPRFPDPGPGDSDGGERQQKVRMRVDDRRMSAFYTNAFRTNASADEVLLDFGLNQTVPTGQPGGDSADSDPNGPQAEMLLTIDQRVIMNYYTAKRLAITLGNIIRRHEQKFGELKLNIADRMKPSD